LPSIWITDEPAELRHTAQRAHALERSGCGNANRLVLTTSIERSCND